MVYNADQRGDYSKQGTHSRKAILCLVTVQASGTTKSPLEADQRPEQTEVKIKSSRR